ncbi:MAG: hypothetical protein O3B73_00490 [bacterium]|nr:hypothetical protein [bacterium]
MSSGTAGKPVDEMDARERARFIDALTPAGGLYTETQRDVSAQSNSSWRVSPEPWWLPPSVIEHLEAMGHHLYAFYKALNLLYSHSLRGLQPGWAARYLDQGKTEEVIKFGQMGRFKSHLPYVIRPDVIPTREGMIASELDSVPGGIGFTASLAERYSRLGYDVVGGADGMVNGFAGMIRWVAERDDPIVGIIVSDEASAYRPEMVYLGGRLNGIGLETYVITPDDVHFVEDGLFVDSGDGRRKLDVIYRFFELFDLRNLPKIDLILYAVRKGLVKMTPPVKAYHEEKMMMGLFHHPMLSNFWRQQLPSETVTFLAKTFPKTWILDPSELPPHAVIPDLTLDGQQFSDWRQLGRLGQKNRQLVIKPSGFSEQAWGSRGVAIGHDMAEADWVDVISHALNSFGESPHVMQIFHNGATFSASYYDFETDQIETFKGRARLQPYYFIVRDEPVLSGVQATVCPADKKRLHGMVDAVILPCGVRK